MLDVPLTPNAVTPPAVTPDAATAASDARVERIGDGFDAIGGATAAPDGTLYFVDRIQQRIYRWDEQRGLGIERDATSDAVNLAADRSGNLMVLSSAGRDGTVYSFRPGSPDGEMTVIAPTPMKRDGTVALALPGNRWNNGEFKDQLDSATLRFTTLSELFARDAATPATRGYVSPDGSLTLPAYRVFQQGPGDYRGRRFSHALDSYGFVTARPGSRVYVSNASEARTYSALVGSSGALTDLKLFAARGGESVAVGPDGRVFVANGQIWIFDRDGTPAGRIDVPERPIQIVFGGRDGQTLFVLGHRALYRIRP